MQHRKLISFVFSAVFSNLKGLGSHILPSQNFYPSLLTDNKINFNVVFPSSNLDTPLNLELGSGTGSWICNQAKKNYRENYVSVEMRTSRVSRTFSHSCLLGIQNLCCISDSATTFLNHRNDDNFNNIYVNHPEPPNQDGGESSDASHMLNEGCLELIWRRLKVGGRFILISDNLQYTQVLTRSIGSLIFNRKLNFTNDSTVVIGSENLRVGESIKSKGSISLDLLKGIPSKSLGYEEGGESYFDGLWKTGAGSHSSRDERYILCLKKCEIREEVEEKKTVKKLGEKSGGGGKKNKKKSAAKQAKRNAKRLAQKGEGDVLESNPKPKGKEEGEGGLSTKDLIKRERKLKRRAERRAEAAKEKKDGEDKE
ncbi:hypothetical protein TrLO_g13723 [Triparma laevis f. longispina]|uniref:tRNA (guanine(46)-N(7))-methyltransferase n=1 Tax=Triparma laevis f. longispina TaxID=1714387 RepID=A0A9W7AI39_9STRA|nr:hypothetical protein TrLO_g13723 [Triparma laevis f. longispina]